MMEFLQQLSQHLHLTKRISIKEGREINVGEHFTVQFTLTNTAPQPISVEDRLIRFKNPYIQIVKTQYARPCMPNGDPQDVLAYEFPNDAIDPGESTSMEFKMLATADMQGWLDFFIQEKIAEAYVSAHLDVDEYFKVIRSYQIRTEINP